MTAEGISGLEYSSRWGCVTNTAQSQEKQETARSGAILSCNSPIIPVQRLPARSNRHGIPLSASSYPGQRLEEVKGRRSLTFL